MRLKGLLIFFLLIVSTSFVFATPAINEVYLAEADNFYSPCAGNDVVSVVANVSNADIVNASFVFENVTIDCSDGGDGNENISLVYNVTTELWEGFCNVSDSAEISNFEGGAIVIIAINVTDFSFDNTSIDSIILYNMTTPVMMGPTCDRFGDSTTNFCEELNFSNINFIVEIESNGTCMEEEMDISLPWEDFQKVITLNFSSLDFTDNETLNNLEFIGDAIVPYITPPGQFGDSYIFVNSTAFSALNTNTSITMYGLPFTTAPNVTGSGNVVLGDFVLNNPYVIEITCEDICEDDGYCPGEPQCSTCIAECELEGEAFNMTVPNSNFTFTVSGFSQYNLSDSEDPVIESYYPDNETEVSYDDSTGIELSAVINGTGTQLSNISFYLNGDLLESWDSSDIYSECTNLTADWDVVNCSASEILTPGEHNFTIVATDFGGDEGNLVEQTTTFNIAICGATITKNLTLTQDLVCSGTNAIIIGANDVTLNCAEYSITYGAANNYYGVYSNYNSTTIQNCNISGFRAGIYIEDSSEHNILGNDIHNNSFGLVSGIYFFNVYDSVITDNNIYENDIGVHMVDSSRNIIDDNYIYSNNNGGATKGYGIYMIDDTEGCFNNTISGNTIEDHNETGIYIDSGDGNTIIENTLTGNKYGVDLRDSAFTTVDYNNIYLNNLSGIGINVQGAPPSSYNNIDNNNITLYFGDGVVGDQIGIYIVDDNNDITNNIVECIGGDPGETHKTYGLSLNGSGAINVENNSLSGNEVSGCIYGLYANSIDYFHADNEDYYSNRYAVYLNGVGSEGTMPLISNSAINDNLRGIWLASISYATIADTESNGNVGEGLYVDGDSTAYVTNGNFEDNTNYGIYDNVSDSVYWTISDTTTCKNNNVSIYGDITFEGGSLELENCIITINGTKTINMTGIITSLEVINQSVGAENATEFEFDNADANITLYLADDVNVTLSVASKMPNASGETALLTSVKGIKININSDASGNLTWALIKIFYDASEITGLDEDSLRIWYYNESSGDWEKYDTPNGGVNKTGKYVWANVTHFSLYGIFGSVAESEGDGTSPTTYSGGGCLTNWTCTEWSTCVDGIQTRECVKEREYCYAPEEKPIESRSCVVSEEGTEEIIGEDEKIEEKSSLALKIVLVGIALIGIFLLIKYVFIRKK